MDAQTQEYFDREKNDWFLLDEYLSSSDQSLDRIDIATEILGDVEMENYIVYVTEEDEEGNEVPVLDEDGNKEIDERDTDRDGIDEAIRNYYDPLSIEKWCKVDPYSNEVTDTDDCKYEIQISTGGPSVYREIDYTATLHMYWGGDHLSREFGRDFADTLLNFYGLY